jgi:hypothetical protein
MDAADVATYVVCAVAIVVAVLWIAWMAWALYARSSLLSMHSTWEQHRATAGASLRAEADQVADSIRAALAGPVPGAVVALKGSVLTGAVRASSDIDVFVWVPTCEGHDTAVQSLLASIPGMTHIHSGGKFTLLTTRVNDKAVDVSVSMDPTDTVLPSELHLRTRGFFEFVARERHPEAAIRTSHV